MSDSVEKDVDKPASLPNLVGRVFTAIFALWLVIVLGQLLQDHYQKEEILDIHRIDSYYQQVELASQVAVSILQLQSADKGIEQDKISALFIKNVSELKATHTVLHDMMQQYQALNETDNLQAEEQLLEDYIDELILYSDEILAMIDAEAVNKAMVSDIYHKILPVYQENQKVSIQLIRKLSAYLEQESKDHRQTIWWSTLGIMLVVLMLGFAFYRRAKRLVHQQFNLIGSVNEELEQDNQLRRQNELALVEQTKQATAQKMKLQSILGSTVDAIITITDRGIIDSFNKAAESMFGYPAEFAIGKNVKMLMPEPYAAEHDGYLENYHKTGEKKIIGSGRQVIGKRVDDSEFPIQLSVSEVIDSEPKLFTGIVQDITEWEKADAKLHQTMTELTAKQTELENEEKIARHVFENITASNSDTIPELTSWCQPMKTFSGDMVLSAILPSGALRVILCDFTGHGLPAALGAVPVSAIHSAMAKKGLPLEILMDELNNKLNALLPTGIFCCIVGVDIDAGRSHVKIWNASLPEVLIVNSSGEIKQRCASDHLALGIKNYDRDEMHCQDVHLADGDAIYLYSDGLTEAENNAGEMIGQTGFEQLLASEMSQQGRITDIKDKVIKFVDGADATDDISLIEIKTLSKVD